MTEEGHSTDEKNGPTVMTLMNKFMHINNT